MAWVTGVYTDVTVCHCRTRMSCKFADSRYWHTISSKAGDVRASAGVHGNELILLTFTEFSIDKELHLLSHSKFLADALDSPIQC